MGSDVPIILLASQIAVAMMPERGLGHYLMPWSPRVCLTCHLTLSTSAGIIVVVDGWGTAFVMCARHGENGQHVISRDALNALVSRLPR